MIKLPIVQIDFFEGRSLEQKREMVKKVTQAIVETLSCPPEAVSIIIREMNTQSFSKAGILRYDEQN